MNVTRHQTAGAFLEVAQTGLLRSEAENNLILGIAQGLARSGSPAAGVYLATVADNRGILACGVHIAPFKLVITRADREPIAALARDAFEAGLAIDGVTGPSRSAEDFAIAWSRLSGIAPKIAAQLRIHEARNAADSGLRSPSGSFRLAVPDDHALLTAWTELFVSDANIPDVVDASRVVEDAITRRRLHVWEDVAPVSMAAWAGKTTNGVRINFVYTPRELRGKGYATACVQELTRQQLGQGNAFCWLYTDRSGSASPNIFRRIGYRPVSDVAEYYLR